MYPDAPDVRHERKKQRFRDSGAFLPKLSSETTVRSYNERRERREALDVRLTTFCCERAFFIEKTLNCCNGCCGIAKSVG